MQLFAEKVLLALVVSCIALLIANPMKLDIPQRVSAAVAILAFGYFVAHSLQKRSSPTQATPASSAAMSSPAPLSGKSSADEISLERKSEAVRPNPKHPKPANREENTEKEAPVPEPPPEPSARIQQTNPVNSPAIIGDHATVNYGPPKPFILSAGDQRRAQEILRGISAPTALDLICIGRGCQSAESLLPAFAETSWQISRATIGMIAAVGGVDLGTGVHIMTKDLEGNAFRVLKSALESINVKYEVAPWRPLSPMPSTASLVLVIGNPG